MRKILWATDGSEEAEEGLNYAVFLARNYGSEIFGVHVIPKPEKLLYKSEFHDWTVKVEENIQSKLREITEKLTSTGLNFRGSVIKGKPSYEILEIAQRENIDLIIMGRSGHGLIDRLLVGSTTLRVLRHSDIPVLAVMKRATKDEVSMPHILVPLEISENVDTAIDYAINLASKIRSKLTVLYVFRLDIYTYEVPASTLVLDDLIKSSSEELTKRVEELKQKHTELIEGLNDVEINNEVIQAINPAVAIADYASKTDVDLIVINTHGRMGIRRLIIGSVTEKVIQEAPCAVLAMKQ